MKTHAGFSKSVLPIQTSVACIAVCLCCGSARAATPYVAHEWGTFTSVQGGDGVLLDWRPLQTSQLPGFVYDWQHPGLNRRPAPYLAFGKAGIASLQRLETPVIYLYSKKAQRVDVSVRFPQGQITEWYPQATQIGPATIPNPPLVTQLDAVAHKAGVSPQFTFASWLPNAATPDSRANWSDIHILSPAAQRTSLLTLPQNSSGSHYFTARNTDANLLQADSLVATNPAPEHEKFIFYRGVGSFATPLKITMNEAGALTVANTGSEPLADLFILQLSQGKGQFEHVTELSAGQRKSIESPDAKDQVPTKSLAAELGNQMAHALVKQGLYPREANAMVHTWSDSWFAEDGVRVLYLLPRAWTDKVLPLTLTPPPAQLVRVMVGRAEMLAPAAEHRLTEQLVKAGNGDSAARQNAIAAFKQLGRFAEPALTLATAGTTPALHQSAWELFRNNPQ